MNVQVNLIRPSELRSASMVSGKSLVLIGGIVVPVVLLLWVAWTYLGSAEASSALRLLEQEKERIAPQQRTATAMRRTLDAQRALRDEATGWGRSRVAWHEVLASAAERVPPTMQWRSLQVRQQLVLDAKDQPVRDFLLTLQGRCQGPGAEAQVEAMRRAWEAEPPLAGRVARATVASYREDDGPGAAKEDRLFQIDVQFNPGAFHAAAGK